MLIRATLIAAIALAATLFGAGALHHLVFGTPGRSWRGAFAPLTPAEERIRGALEERVSHLAETIGPRDAQHRPQALEEAASWLEGELEALGWTPRAEPYPCEAGPVRNIVAEKVGVGAADRLVVIAAHYDSVPGSPGADDNASAVAVLLELAGLLRDAQHSLSIRLLFPVNEEAPWSKEGSAHHARGCRTRGETVAAMYSLEMLGFYRTAAGSQHYPDPLRPFFPDTGDFVAFVGNLRSRGLMRRSLRAFRNSVDFPSEGIAAPRVLEDLERSDHGPFWDAGYPALMITDTANFRNPAYHSPRDTPDTLDYGRMARLTVGLKAMVDAEARVDPLTR
jgi:hypothetical protein